MTTNATGPADRRTTVGELSLTQFLLARVAEDEAAVSQFQTIDVLRQRRWGRTEVLASVPVPSDRARVLAQCKANRRIVDLAHLADEEGAEPVYLAALRALAAVYSDHPEYREEWRP